MEIDSQMIGKIIDSYEITELIGRGGMGVVFKARDVKLDRDVALKIMDPLLAREETFLRRFWSEAKALAKLQNPYIVGIYAVRETEYGICIVMEYVDGETLGDLIKASGALPADKTVRLFKQLLMAFEHAHGAGIIHRDVKPANILVTPNNVVKVTDFGLAKICQPSAATMTSIAGGTLFYASPEQLEGLGKVDHRGDIYSIGMTLYESLTGAVPFENTESDFAIREKIVKGRIPSPRKENPSIPAELNAIVMKAIAKDPGDRFQTATEMREALEHFEASARRAPPRTARTRQRALKPQWLAVPALIVLVALGVLLLPSLFPGGEATLTVGSIPRGARVEMNGRTLGTTPLFNVAVGTGQAVVKVIAEGFLPKDTTIAMSSGKAYAVRVVLQSTETAATQDQQGGTLPKTDTTRLIARTDSRGSDQKIARQGDSGKQGKSQAASQGAASAAAKTGTIVVTVIPPSASVWIDKIQIRSTSHQVTAGEHFVRVEADRHKYEKWVSVAPGGSAHVPVDFTKEIHVAVAANDLEGNAVWGARIFLDGVPQAVTPWQVTMPLGMHTISLRCDGYEDPRPITRCFEKDMVHPNTLSFVLKKAP